MALATKEPARTSVATEGLVAAQSRTHENTKLLDEAKANLDKEEKAAAFVKAKEAAAEKPENGDGEEAAAPAPEEAPESTLQIRVRVLSQKAEDLKADELVTSALEQAADAADAREGSATSPRPTRLN